MQQMVELVQWLFIIFNYRMNNPRKGFEPLRGFSYQMKSVSFEKSQY